MLSKFWRTEEVEDKVSYTIEEKACKKHFEETATRDSDRRFVVQLPCRDNISLLGNSYDIAKRRFLSLERRLEKNSELKKE